MVLGFLVSIIIWIVSLLIFYVVIETAVKNGINKSGVGHFLEKKYAVKENKKSFLDHDLDNEN